MTTKQERQMARRRQREVELRRAQQARTRNLIALGVIVLIAVLGAGIFAWKALASNDGSSAASAIPCDIMEHGTYHVHAHLSIYENGQPVTVPAGIGIESTCLRWLHTHDTDGIIHVEAPRQANYTLGEFFAVWGQPLDSTHLLDKTADANHKITAFVNGKQWTGNPRDIPLAAHNVITLEYGTPIVPPQPYTFPPGD